jgi:hypothetical protein
MGIILGFEKLFSMLEIITIYIAKNNSKYNKYIQIKKI